MPLAVNEEDNVLKDRTANRRAALDCYCSTDIINYDVFKGMIDFPSEAFLDILPINSRRARYS